MIARLLISKSINTRNERIEKLLIQAGLTKTHPDLLLYSSDSKLGIEQARKIKEHFSLKPYSAKQRAVVLEEGGNLTPEAQNALLKILEELPVDAIFLLGVNSLASLLPTVISRCEVITLKETFSKASDTLFSEVEKLLTSSFEERFQYIEKLKEKEEFLQVLISYFHQNLKSNLSPKRIGFIKELLQAEEWANQNVNLRAILEYLMLKMPGN